MEVKDCGVGAREKRRSDTHPIELIALLEHLGVHDPPGVIAEPRRAVHGEDLLVHPERRGGLADVVEPRGADDYSVQTQKKIKTCQMCVEGSQLTENVRIVVGGESLGFHPSLTAAGGA